MSRIRLASLVAAAVITATQWAPFFSPLPHAASLRLVAARLLDDVLHSRWSWLSPRQS